MKSKASKNQKRDSLLAVKVTADEKRRISEYASSRCVNVSALVRKLLLDKLDEK